MTNLNLQPEEGILLQNANVCSGGFFASYTDELYLTSMNIIHVSKNMFGKVKSVNKYPLDLIKMAAGIPQVTVGATSNGIPELQIYFNAEQRAFTFQKGKKEASKWVTAITTALKDRSKATASGAYAKAIPGTELLAETLRDTIGKFKETFGLTAKTENITIECIGCGAILTGEKGSQTVCNYCKTVQTLQQKQTV